MGMVFASNLVMSIAGNLRLIAVVLGLSIVLAGSNACPTGQTGCDMVGMTDMIGMDAIQGDDAICVLACGVPLLESLAMVGSFIGKASVVAVPPIARSASIDIAPDIPPPRILA
jgi:hypothetical protein